MSYKIKNILLLAAGKGIEKCDTKSIKKRKYAQR